RRDIASSARSNVACAPIRSPAARRRSNTVRTELRNASCMVSLVHGVGALSRLQIGGRGQHIRALNLIEGKETPGAAGGELVAKAETEARHCHTFLQVLADVPTLQVIVALRRAVVEDGQDASGHGAILGSIAGGVVADEPCLEETLANASDLGTANL